MQFATVTVHEALTERQSRSCLFSRSIHMLDIRRREKRAVLGGHVRRSRENVIAEKKRERNGARGVTLFLSRALAD